jgi:phospholipase D1/2
MRVEGFFQLVRHYDSIRHADRFSLLIDGMDYFRVLREAITRSGRTVFIPGRAVDDHMKLTPESTRDDYSMRSHDAQHRHLYREPAFRVHYCESDGGGVADRHARL